MNLDWLDILSKVFDVAIIPILGAATIYLVTLINVKKDEILKKTKDEMTEKYIELLNNTIIECVLATNQTYVEALKKQGSFDVEAQKHAFELTYKAVLDILSEDAEMYLNEVIKDLQVYITNKIEAQVIMLK